MVIAVVIGLAGGSLVAPSSCAGLAAPVDGEIMSYFAPLGRYLGHWGVDFSASEGTTVRSAAGGTVTFAGSVAGRLSVTVHHGGGLRTSYSYLSKIRTRHGARVAAGQPIAASGRAHGDESLHFSVRVGDRYRHPIRWLQCVRSPAAALRLAPVFGWSVYPRERATRHTRRDVRSPSPRSPLCR